ncbi:hypothetical protein NHX12_022048 [Muraenolepis orangiensis]|uniref:Uncharacterized protein n=1 Tax=Muraenolepis orangiensis TaxID=630683 RepID=A0A9Q0IT28_9TELE|nr:hypothetical protein NHX12_022048 [Muraenolepis orangiensis]
MSCPKKDVGKTPREMCEEIEERLSVPLMDHGRKEAGRTARRMDGGDASAGAVGDVARARWTLLRQVLHQKQVDSPEVKQVSVRRFATFDLFTRSRVVPSCLSDDQWVEYRSVSFPEYSAYLRDNLGPLRVNEVLNSFDNTGNVCNLVRSVSGYL